VYRTGAAMSHATFTDDDKIFIRAILTNPAELTAWLVYADWLDEHDDNIRAEFLRLSVRLNAPETTQTDRFGIIGQLEDLRPLLNADWVAVFDRTYIENCDQRFAFQCPKQWEKLQGTDDPAVRHCDTCKKKVYYCRTKREAYDHAQQGDCVAIDSALPYWRGDLEHDPDVPLIVRIGE
jgi:uncharacterized protein (TIGR02996 family)